MVNTCSITPPVISLVKLNGNFKLICQSSTFILGCQIDHQSMSVQAMACSPLQDASLSKSVAMILDATNMFISLSLWSNDVIWRRKFGLSLDYSLACRLFGANIWPEFMLNHREQISVKYDSKYKNFYSTNALENADCKMLVRLSRLPRAWGDRRRLMPWWRHQMETFYVLLALCAGNSPVTVEFPAKASDLVTRSFDVFFDSCLE